MKKFLFIGLIIVIIDIIIYLIANDINMIPFSSGITGGIFLLLAALMVRAFIQPDSRRVDNATESSQSVERRTKWATRFFLLSLPSILVCITSFILIYKM